MRITRLEVRALFERFDHSLDFKPDEHITIMIGPNGFGKTMILRIVNALFNQPVRSLTRFPFREVSVRLDNGSHLSVLRAPGASSDQKPGPTVKLVYEEDSQPPLSFTPERQINPRELGFSLGLIESVLPFLDQVGPTQWRDRRTGEVLELEDVFDRFGDELPRMEADTGISLPSWLQHIRGAIPVRYIDTERLTHALPDRTASTRLPRHPASHVIQRTVRRYARDLAERIQRTLTEYASLAQSLDRTFPSRVVERPVKSGLTMDKLRDQLAEIETKRARLVEAGLLVQEHPSWGVPVLDLDKVDEARRGVLEVYANDARQKLSVFDDLYARVDSLKRIANARFLHKRVTIGADGLCVEASDGSRLELEMLSSGEQHEIVMLYELLFRVPNNAFILIDEPELSLHVAWQEQFLADLEEMAKLSRFRVLLATHSPQIIGDRWDLTVELKGPNGE